MDESQAPGTDIEALDVSELTSLPELMPAEPDLGDPLIAAFILDIARGLFPAEELAKRYLLGSRSGLEKYLQRHPGVTHEASRLQAIERSDVGQKGRLRAQAGHVLEHGMLEVARILMDPKTPHDIKVKICAVLMKVADVDGSPAIAKGDQGGGGTKFFLQINLPGGAAAPIIEGHMLPTVGNE